MRASLVVSVLVALSLVGASLCWAPDGHRIVAHIAQHLLTPVTWKAVYTWTGGRNMSDIANDADTWLYLDRQGNGWSAPMHYINSPVNATSFDPNRDCAGPCVYTAIQNYTNLLRKYPPNPTIWTNTTGGEPNVLSFLVHYIGDLHQPMHCGFDVDRGGNSLWVNFFGRPVSLHYLWDNSLIA